MQAEFQCSYSLQLPLGNQQQILTAHFHVSSFAFPLGRALVLLHRPVGLGEGYSEVQVVGSYHLGQ